MIVIPAGIYRFKDDVKSYKDAGVEFMLPFRVMPTGYVNEEGQNCVATIDNCNVMVCVKVTSKEDPDYLNVIIGYGYIDTDKYEIRPIRIYENGQVVVNCEFVAPVYMYDGIAGTPWDMAFFIEDSDIPIFASQVRPTVPLGFGQTIEVLSNTIIPDVEAGRWFLENTDMLLDHNIRPTAVNVANITRSLINRINEFTNKYDTNLTDAVTSIIDKYNTLERLPRSEDNKF